MKKITFLAFFLFAILNSFSQERLSSEMLLFPNSASTQINLVLPVDVAPTDISVYDLSGRLIKNIPLNNGLHYTIDTSQLTEGMYLVAVTSELETRVRKFMVDPNSMNSYSYYHDSNEKPVNQVSFTAKTTTGTKSLAPLDDAYLEGGNRFNTSVMKVYTSWRSSYFKFDLNSIPGKITSAKLKFTVDSDAGSGLIQVFKGSSTNWTEDNLSTTNRPAKSSSPIGTTTGTHSIGKRVVIDLDVNNLSNSLQSLVMVQPTGMNDFAFVSKEHATKAAPELVITYEGSDDSSDNTDNTDTTDTTDTTNDNSSNTGGSNSSSLAPLDDAYIEGSTRHNTSIVKVYTTWRSAYLKFDLRSIPGTITGASLKFTIDSDPGNGLIQVYKGNSTNWTEDNLSTSNRPAKSSSPIGTTTGTHSLGNRVSIDLDVNSLSNSLLSLVMTQAAGTDDIAFVSKEHATKAAPELVITYEGSGDTTDTTDDTTDTTDDTTNDTTDDTTDNSDASNSILTPLDDAYIEGSTSHNTTISKVYTTWRSSYLKFDLRSVPTGMTSATLQFTIESDDGNGLLQVYKGNSTNWTEENLSTTNRPAKGSSPIGSVNSTYAIGQRISIALDINNLSNELLSLVMVQAPDTDDIAFVTKEHATKKGPELVITYGDEPDGDTGKPPTEDEPVNFEISFESMQVLFDMQDALSAYTNAKRQEWLKKQENKFKEEINRQLGTNHGSFPVAQKDFFKNFEKNLLRIEQKAYEVEASHSRKANALQIEQQPFTEELFDLREWDRLSSWCGPHQTADCKRLSNTYVRGVKLGNLSGSGLGQTRSPELDRLMKVSEKDFSTKEFESGQNKAWAEGIEKIIQNSSLLNGVVNNHINNYGNKGLEDKIFLMTAYLVQYNNRNKSIVPLAVPIGQYKIPPFWSNQTVLDMGKQNAPPIPDSVGVFGEYWLLNEYERCIYTGSRSCDGFEDLKEEIIKQHINELKTSEYLLTERVLSSDVPWDETKKGNYNDQPSLKYTATRDIKVSGRLLKEFRLENGDSLLNGIYPMDPYSSEGEEVTFYYSRSANEWYQYDVPPTYYQETDLDYFINGFWNGPAKFVGRYVIPVEDIIILIDGKDFDGVQSSRLKAGGFLLLEVIPGTKLWRPVSKVLNNAKEWIVLYRVGDNIYTRVIREISDSTKIVYDEFCALFNAGEAVKKLLFEGKFADNIINEVAEELPELAAKKGRKLTWTEILELFKRGNDFDNVGRLKYEFNEIVLTNGKRLDSYIPGQRIISRKATDVDNIIESTWRKYCNELITKYKIGTKLNSRKLPNSPPLAGQYYLEIPLSNKTAANMAEYIRIAREYGIEIIFLAE